MSRALVLAGLLAMLCVKTAFAQQTTPVDPVADAPIRLGVFGIGPKVSLNNFGWDNNVFNEAVDPKGDFTFTVAPAADLWMRTGQGLLTVEGSLDLVYYAEYANQRAVNNHLSGLYEYRFTRIRPLISFAVADVKDRPGFEIDARVRHYDDTLTAGADFRVASKTFFELAYRHQTTVYDDGQVYNGQDLKQTLDRELDAVDGTIRHRLTSQTTLIFRASSEQERFDYATERNSNSGRGSIGVELGSLALIRGKAAIGFRSLAAADGGTIPTYSGLTSEIDVSYTAPSQTRITAKVPRDIQYSYDPVTPYYVQTGIELTLTQRITGRWDFQALGARDRLDYQSSVDPTAERIDHVNRVGGGIGYQIAPQTRMSFDVQNSHRQSEQRTDYRTTRAFLSVNYVY